MRRPGQAAVRWAARAAREGRRAGQAGQGAGGVAVVVVAGAGEGAAARGCVVRAVPVRGEGGGALLEDAAAAVRAEDVVAEAEVLVEGERALGDPLPAVEALDLVGSAGGARSGRAQRGRRRLRTA